MHPLAGLSHSGVGKDPFQRTPGIAAARQIDVRACRKLRHLFGMVANKDGVVTSAEHIRVVSAIASSKNPIRRNAKPICNMAHGRGLARSRWQHVEQIAMTEDHLR